MLFANLGYLLWSSTTYTDQTDLPCTCNDLPDLAAWLGAATDCHGFLFVLQELQAVDSNDVLGLNRKRCSSNKPVIVSDDEDETERNDECGGDSFSSEPKHTGLSVVLSFEGMPVLLFLYVLILCVCSGLLK